MNAKGFALLEWLIASAMVIAIAGAVLGTVGPIRDVIERTQHRVDLVGAARAALEVMVADVREAGSSAGVAAGGASLANVLPPVVLNGPTNVRLHRVPRAAAQGRLKNPAFAGDSLITLHTAARCALGPPACGFAEGDRAVIYTGNVAEVVVIHAVLQGAVTLKAPLKMAFPTDAVLSRLLVVEYSLEGVVNNGRLVRISDGGAKQPVLDNIVALELSLDDQNIAKAARFRVRLRIQSAAAHLRGPQGALFVHGGTATGPRQWVPDVELRAEVALRNRGETW